MMYYLNYFLKKIKYKIRDKLPEKLRNYISLILSKTNFNNYSEQYKSFGSLNPTITFYIIRIRPPGWGFFSTVFFVLQGLLYAQRNNYIPFVDIETYWLREWSHRKKINGTRNAWCHFFNQVSNYSLEEVYKSKNVVLSDGSNILGRSHWLTNRKIEMATSPILLKDTKKLISSYLSLNEETSRHILATKKKLNWSPEETLGVFIRGTVYYSKTPMWEDRIPSLKFFISEVDKFLTKKQLKNIYIATEDYRIYLALQKRFSGNHILPSIRYNLDQSAEEWISLQKTTYDSGLIMGYTKTLDYLSEMTLLSECTNFIGTLSNASAFVLASCNLDTGDHRIVLKDKVVYLNNTYNI
jgi:hypothetical protein